jgi:hypothetical protein
MQSDGRGKLTAAAEDTMAEHVLDAVDPIRDGAVADVSTAAVVAAFKPDCR